MRTDARRPDELITASGIAELLDVVPSAVSNWRKRNLDPPFPAPWFEVPTHGAVYRAHALFVREEVESWHADHAARISASSARRIASLERQLARARARAGRRTVSGTREGKAQ